MSKHTTQPSSSLIDLGHMWCSPTRMENLMPSFHRMCMAVAFAGSVVTSLLAQQPPPRPRGIPQPPDPGTLFFSEHWRNPKTYDANTLPLTSVTQEAVTTPDLVLNVYDPNAKYIPEYRKTLRWGSWAEDWAGPTCLMIYGIQRPELWGGSCGAVTVTRFDRSTKLFL